MKIKTLSPLEILCTQVRESVAAGQIESCIPVVHNAMAQFPDAPSPTTCWASCWRKWATIPAPCGISGQPGHWIPPMHPLKKI